MKRDMRKSDESGGALDRQLEITNRRIDELQLPLRSPRRHSRRTIRMLAAAIAEYRHVTPGAID